MTNEFCASNTAQSFEFFFPFDIGRWPFCFILVVPKEGKGQRTRRSSRSGSALHTSPQSSRDSGPARRRSCRLMTFILRYLLVCCLIITGKKRLKCINCCNGKTSRNVDEKISRTLNFFCYRRLLRKVV